MPAAVSTPVNQFEMVVDALRFPSGVGEHGVVESRQRTFDRHERHSGRLDAGTEGEDVDHVVIVSADTVS